MGQAKSDTLQTLPDYLSNKRPERGCLNGLCFCHNGQAFRGFVHILQSINLSILHNPAALPNHNVNKPCSLLFHSFFLLCSHTHFIYISLSFSLNLSLFLCISHLNSVFLKLSLSQLGLSLLLFLSFVIGQDVLDFPVAGSY